MNSLGARRVNGRPLDTPSMEDEMPRKPTRPMQGCGELDGESLVEIGP